VNELGLVLHQLYTVMENYVSFQDTVQLIYRRCYNLRVTRNSCVYVVLYGSTANKAFIIHYIKKEEERGMKAMAKLIVFALIGFLIVANSGHAATIESLQRSLTMDATEIQSSALGTYNEGLSFPGEAKNYNPDYGYNLEGVRTYQGTSVLNDLAIMTVSGHGGINLWWTNGFAPSASSHLSLCFTTLTAASYTFSYGVDGGMVTFQDMITGDYFDTGIGTLIAGHEYQLVADVNISNPDLVYFGAFWGLDLTVQEQPAAVPLPNALLLLGPGLVSLFAVKRRL